VTKVVTVLPGQKVEVPFEISREPGHGEGGRGEPEDGKPGRGKSGRRSTNRS
jgi:hypothetical protein